MRPSAARAGEHLVFADIQPRTVSPQFVEKQLSEAAQLLLVEAVTQSHRGEAAARSRKYTPGLPCAMTWPRAFSV
jgi:hypothetical protein